MNEQAKAQLAGPLAGVRLPRYRELPTVGLYLEQVTRYINGALLELGGPELTSSMVSNYVKQKLIPGPVKKAYSAESLAYLMVIACIKSVASLEDIRLMIGVQQDSYPLEVAYDYFCAEFENLLQTVCGVKETADRVGSEDTREKELLRTALLALTHRIYLDHYLRWWSAGHKS